MRILVVHNTLNDSKSVSGGLRHFLLMANAWHKMGHSTDFLAAEAGRKTITNFAPDAHFISSDSFFDATKNLAQTWRYFPAYGYRLLTAHTVKLPHHYDVILASTQLIVEVYPAMVLAKLQRSKLAVKIHHVLATQRKHFTLNDRLFLWSEKVTARWINRHADLVICGTKLVQNDFNQLTRKLGLPPKASTTIGYGVDLEPLLNMGKREKIYDAVYLGRLHEHKGVFELPGIWKKVTEQCPGAKLLVIGEGPHRSQMEKLFQQENLANSVTITGAISEESKNDFLAQSRLGITVSFEEGWGLSVNEFLAAGMPVVGYSLPIFDLVFPGRLLLKPSRDQTGVADLIVQLLNSPERQSFLGQEGREFVKRYDFRQVAEEELGALHSLLQRDSTPSAIC
ncbi:MAG: glycosyltransferase family 4 protein [Verrucomicrobiota bacterium]|nr:glycosyltransferase family 4 protein [Verrucomicrobiota bacterium]